MGHWHNNQGEEDRPCLAQGVQTPFNFTNADLLFNFNVPILKEASLSFFFLLLFSLSLAIVFSS